jgi:hypothetical protein
MDSLPGQINPYTALSYQDHLRSTFDLSCSQVIDAARRPLAWLYLLQAVEASAVTVGWSQGSTHLFGDKVAAQQVAYLKDLLGKGHVPQR